MSKHKFCQNSISHPVISKMFQWVLLNTSGTLPTSWLHAPRPFPDPQAFAKAESLFVRGGRKIAQSAVLTLTDGNQRRTDGEFS